jgi:subtilisin family serine protease
MSRRLVTLLSILGLAVVLLPPAPGLGAALGAATGGPNPREVEESSTGSYVVIMATDPLVADYDRHDLNTVRARADRERIRASHRLAMRDAGVADAARVSDLTNVVNGFTVVASHDEAVALAAQPGVARVVPDVERYLTTDSSPDFLGLDGRGEAWGRGIDGRGVVVGVIDSGIWPEHPSFADDGSYTYPAGVNPDIPCEFGNTDHNPADAAFECNDKLLGARQVMATYEAVVGIEDFEFDSARDHHGHGSHTASTAAGNRGVPAEILGRDLGTVSGIAPRAHIIAYKTAGGEFGQSMSSDLALAIDTAVGDGVDVINYSIGSGNLTGVESIAFLFAAEAGVFIAASAGNEGNGPGAVGGTMPWLTTVAASTQRRFFPGRIVLGNGETYLGASLTHGVGNSPLVDAADAGSADCEPGLLDPTVVDGAIVLCGRGVGGCRCELSEAVLEAGGVGMVVYDPFDDNNLYTDAHSVPAVHIDNTPGLAIKDYVATAAKPTARLVVQNTTTSWPSAPSITKFSSRGPNLEAPDIIKPDITAPGIQILAAHSPYAGAGEMFQAIAGTSMSSPHIAGVYALLKQRHPDWSPAAARSALMTTARHDVVDNDRVTPAGPFATGSGHVDPGKPLLAGSMFQPGLVYDAGFNDYLGFLCSEGPEVFADPATTCAELETLGYPTDPSNLNYPSIGIAELVDTETVARTVTNLGRRATYRVSIDAPAGFDVEVTPSSFTVDPGDSVTYEVTVTNDGTGNPGEWSTGSLTWTAGGYEVYSPIAVNTLLFDAPTEVAGAGTDGSASFDVRFGYTGEYTATAHGLETATVISDTVVQDPNQAFDPADGFSTIHELDLTGAVALHLAIPPEAADPGTDLDLYVLDPTGDFGGASFNPGTDEEVTIFDPMPGVWTVYVHGWDTVDDEAAYDLSTWIVPGISAGSLTVDSAPDSAQIGETGTIDLSWAGAEQGLNIGVVAHSDADGPLGYTLVEVDNP